MQGYGKQGKRMRKRIEAHDTIAANEIANANSTFTWHKEGISFLSFFADENLVKASSVFPLNVVLE